MTAKRYLAELSHSVILDSSEFVDKIKDLFLRGKQPNRELLALKDMTSRAEMKHAEQVVHSVVPSDEKLGQQVKLYLCHRYSGERLREI